MNQLNERPRWALVAVLLPSCAAALYLAYPAIQERRENARLKEELRRQRLQSERLRGLMDTLTTGKRPAPIYNL